MADPGVPSTSSELREALDSLIATAHEAGLHVGDRAFALQYDDPDIPDYEIHITRVDGDQSSRG